MARLGDVATYVNGFAFKPSDWSDDGLPIIRIQDLTGNAYQANRYNGEYHPKYEVNDGDVLISWSASLGVYVWKGEKAVLNQHIFKVVFDKMNIDKSFFVHQAQSILARAESEVHGATMKHLTKPIFDALPFYLPDIERQREIAAVLDKVSTLISLRKQQLAKLDELVKARFVEMFGDPICNSKNLILSPLNDVCTKITDGTHDTPPRYDSGYLLITGKNIRSSGIIFNDIEFVSEEDHKIIYSRCNPEYGDVLYTNIGVNYGTACYNNLDYEFSMKNVALLKPNHRIVNGYYLWECLNIMRNHILSMNQVGGAQTFMGLATIKKIPIPVPPIELQNQFATFV